MSSVLWTCMRVGRGLLAGIGLMGCATETASTTAQPWRLVGLYDSASMLALQQQEGGAPPPGQPWRPILGMTETCGPVKHPDGLGVFEAEAMAAGLSPALIVLLEADTEVQVNPPAETNTSSTSDSKIKTPALTNKTLRVNLIHPSDPNNERSTRLHPMVEPRALALSLSWEGQQVQSEKAEGQDVKGQDAASQNAESKKADAEMTPPDVRLVETQLRVELCMEHKTGRAWISGEGQDVREAYLLDPPRDRDKSGAELKGTVLGGDRRHYAGQGSPVPALLGPSDACIRSVGGVKAEEPARGSSANETIQAKGEGSLDLIPTDVWGAELRACPTDMSDGKTDGYHMPWRLDRSGGAVPLTNDVVWSDLSVHLSWQLTTTTTGSTTAPSRPLVTLTLGRERLLDQVPLKKSQGGQPGEEALEDLLAHVPLQYPLLAGADGTNKSYTALIIPAWQINEALKDSEQPAQGDVLDGVGWALRHPELIEVIVREGRRKEDAPCSPEGSDEQKESDEHKTSGECWVNLMSGAVGEEVRLIGKVIEESKEGNESKEGKLKLQLFQDLRSWGYTVGHLNSRAQLLGLGSQEPRWSVTLVARRADAQAMFLLCSAALLILTLPGLRRVRDLWSAVPEEAVTWWPTPPDASGKPPPPPEGS